MPLSERAGLAIGRVEDLAAENGRQVGGCGGGSCNMNKIKTLQSDAIMV